MTVFDKRIFEICETITLDVTRKSSDQIAVRLEFTLAANKGFYTVFNIIKTEALEAHWRYLQSCVQVTHESVIVGISHAEKK